MRLPVRSRSKCWHGAVTSESVHHFLLLARSLLPVVAATYSGVVALQAIDVDEIHEIGPPIVVPKALYMTVDSARKRFPALTTVRPHIQLAAFLAAERQQGSNSMWEPYITSLPPQPPCAWLMGDEDRRGALASLPESVLAAHGGSEGWYRAIIRARASMEQQAAVALRLLRLDLTVPEMLWASGQVLSRGWGLGNDLGLAPFIDLLNHQAGALKPCVYYMDSEKLFDGSSKWSQTDTSAQARGIAFVLPTHEGKIVGLASGEELYTCYANRCSALDAFLSFGFVPPELLV